MMKKNGFILSSLFKKFIELILKKSVGLTPFIENKEQTDF